MCEHATLSDIKTLSRQTSLPNDQIQRCSSPVISNCTGCRASATPPPNQRLFISSPYYGFNVIVTIDCIFMGAATLLHVTDAAKIFSAAHVVSLTSSEKVETGFEPWQLKHFWTFCSIQGDVAFVKTVFINFVGNDLNGWFRPVLPRRHPKRFNCVKIWCYPINSISIEA